METEPKKYIVFEIQTNSNGAVGTLVTSYDDRPHAESAYHGVLASAAISSLPCHACVLLTNTGEMLECRVYEREAE